MYIIFGDVFIMFDYTGYIIGSIKSDVQQYTLTVILFKGGENG
jgi:hypothetical protein